MGFLIEELADAQKKALIFEIARKKSGDSDKDWSELTEEFDLDVSPETLRKAGVGVKLAEAAGMLRSMDEAEEASQGVIDRMKLRELSAKVNEMYRKEARVELLAESVKEAAKGLKPMQPLAYREIPRESDKALVLCIGDVHYGAKIHVKGLNGETINRFDGEVFEARMQRLLQETIAILKKENIATVHVFLVGDLIDGMLRQSQLIRLEYGLVESTMRFSEYMANWILSLSMYADVHVAACSGNHSEVRPLGSKRREFEAENMEKIILWYMAARLDEMRDEGIDIDVSCERFNKKEVLGHTFLLLHGDAEKDISKFADESIRLYGEPIDFFVCGHKHRENEYPTGMTQQGTSAIVRVPSLCGVDTYANSKNFGGAPGALAMVMEMDYGRRCIYPIRLA